VDSERLRTELGRRNSESAEFQRETEDTRLTRTADNKSNPVTLLAIEFDDIRMIAIGQYGCLPRFVPAGRIAGKHPVFWFLIWRDSVPSHNSSIMKSSRGTVFCDASVFTFPVAISTTDRVTLICLWAKSMSLHCSPIRSPQRKPLPQSRMLFVLRHSRHYGTCRGSMPSLLMGEIVRLSPMRAAAPSAPATDGRPVAGVHAVPPPRHTQPLVALWNRLR
jgi:hypothetical protein